MLILIDENGGQGQDKELIQKLNEVFGLVVCASKEEAMRALERQPQSHENGSGTTRPANVIPLHGNKPSVFARGLTELVDELESKMVHEAMAHTGNNQVRAADLLKITRGALQYKLKKYVKKEAA